MFRPKETVKVTLITIYSQIGSPRSCKTALRSTSTTSIPNLAKVKGKKILVNVIQILHNIDHMWSLYS